MGKETSMKMDVSVTGDQNVSLSSYGIAAALTEALEAAVFADSSAAYKAYEMIEHYAYGPTNSANGSRELQMAHFTMRDSAGRMQDVSIPVITMMPLPLLHVTEATFDIDLEVNLHTAEQESSTMYLNQGRDATGQQTPLPGSTTQESSQLANMRQEARQMIATYKRNNRGISPKVHEQRADNLAKLRRQLSSLIQSEARRIAYKNDIISSSTRATGSSLVIASKSKEDENTTNTRIRVSVKMEQHQLPDGIKSLLLAAANSLTVKEM
jgi:hypothetical protein